MLENLNKKLTILVSPLPWGLGHATRCIPIINELLEDDRNVIICATGESKTLLSLHFPHLQIITIKGYSIKYSRCSRFFSIKILQQIPAILASIIAEHFCLKRLIKKYKIDVVIADNRPGMYNRAIHSIYITHQLRIKTGQNFTGKIINYIHHFFIKKFDECWVPDDENNSLAGELSRSGVLNNVKYIGPLSRLNINPNEQIRYDFICILSGPEPQRTLLENILIKQIDRNNCTVFFVRGTTTSPELIILNKTVEVVNILDTEELNKKIQQSNLVICRSGYSSIMDLIKLKKKAILIPTPRQTEQEYLANYHLKNNIFLSCDQDKCDIEKALIDAKHFPYNFPEIDMDLYKIAIKNLMMTQAKTLPIPQNFWDNQKT